MTTSRSSGKLRDSGTDWAYGGDVMSVADLRKKVKSLMDKLQFPSAVFWADKLVTLSKDKPSDVYLLASCLFHSRHFHRAAEVVKRRNLHQENLNCRFIAALAYLESKEYELATEIIDLPAIRSDDQELLAALEVIKGRLYETQDDTPNAVECYKKALEHDGCNYEALYLLVNHHMLSKEDELEVLLVVNRNEFTYNLYSSLLKKYDEPEKPRPPILRGLENNVDLLTNNAEKLFYNCDYRRCHELINEILDRDPFCPEALEVQIACLMELNKVSQLYILAHKLIDTYPDHVLSWYAVGCYYYLVRKAADARKYLEKATTLRPAFGPAWLLYGHAYAVENEHDQAMAAYFKANHLMPGNHLPTLYVGLEYQHQASTKLAEKFFEQAQSIAPKDPFVIHELGVAAYENGDYDAARGYFEKALELIQKPNHSALPEKWEPLLNNLGHVYRKLKMLDKSIECHQQALVLNPYCSSTLANLGFAYSLKLDWDTAIDHFHQALAHNRDDTFSTTMLQHILELMLAEKNLNDPPSSEAQVPVKEEDGSPEVAME
ncbi:cell division cycle protein 16 homolog [Galendromus occidentalis]|uniref:Cell division cycle protein 16 homolog n=1 Tax=Galendromus occidentalis TaxID=34638 RepID=A0AAJ6VYL1_9ACAR|nr:cell division cycle protein 16 homolog [Galendromus occidentalis]